MKKLWNKKLIVLLLMLGVTGFVHAQFQLDTRGLDGDIVTCDFSEIQPAAGPMGGWDFVAYCNQYQEDLEDDMKFNWQEKLDFYNAQHGTNLTFDAILVNVYDDDEGVVRPEVKKYVKHFTAVIADDNENTYNFVQNFFVFQINHNLLYNRQVAEGEFETDEEREGAAPGDVEYVEDLDALRGKPIVWSNFSSNFEPLSCEEVAHAVLIHDNAVKAEGNDDPCYITYKIVYHVHDSEIANFMGSYCRQSELATVTEYQKLKLTAHYDGVIEPIFYQTDPPAPEETVDFLVKHGANIFSYSSWGELEVVKEVQDDESHAGYILRTYYLRPKDCTLGDHRAVFTQKLIQRKSDLTEFELDYGNATDDSSKGWAKITFPEEDGGCGLTAYDEAHLSESYILIWHDEKNNEDYEGDFGVENELDAGDWTAYVYPVCQECSFNGQEEVPVFKESFKIKEEKTKLLIRYGAGFFSNYVYLSAYGFHKYAEYEDDELPEGLSYDGQEHLMALLVGTYFKFNGWTLDINSENNSYTWSVRKGTEIWEDEYPSGTGENSGIYKEWAQRQKEMYGEHFIVAKGLKQWEGIRSMTFSRYHDGELVDHVTQPVYMEKIFCSDDPNSIFGPVGYTTADSTVVRMISPKDDVTYTIQFENNPEFATAAAARVKIECPLDEHCDPTSFRLGNFGFGPYTFEVPPMSDYYNQRIDMDSLGYWLDVTASIRVPENVAYWIFQTIDPSTGVAPINSMGFLPVNDTLTGEGEGFVTFTMASKPVGRSNGISTGETIEEQADIFFDENDVVPTNRYVNTFDGIAPTSSIVCDTTGASANASLNIGFIASDDDNGSGLACVELYVNIDQAGYELVGQVNPDSVYNYKMARGSTFEFMGLAVDNVGNKEAFKPYSELSYSRGAPPYDLQLSNNEFAENDQIGSTIGSFTTFDDQDTDNFIYALVSGEGDDDNALFTIDGDVLKTHYDFRCHGNYEFTIRVRTTDLANSFFEKKFTLVANPTETIETTTAYEYLCPGESCFFAGTWIATEGTYYDTLTAQHGCDSLVRLIVMSNPSPVTTEVAGDLCYGSDYADNGFSLSADSLAQLTSGWTMEDDLLISVDRYFENSFGCYDTTRLALTIHPAFAVEDEVLVCPTDLPFLYQGVAFSRDTTAVFRYAAATGCDSTYTLRMTLNPDYGPQSDQLTAGWNWYSTFIDQSNGRGLENFENALGGQAQMIKSQTAFTNYYPNDSIWYGNLVAMDNTSMYMVKMTNPHAPSVTGCYAMADTIRLDHGWNWIGYPMTDTTEVNDLTTAIGDGPSHNDVIKSKMAFAIYDADYDIWFGSLSELTSGKGYMYLSQSNAVKPLYYPNGSRKSIHPLDIPSTHWLADHAQFPYNMTMTGIICLDGQLIASDTLEVGAFVNGEKRGSGRAVYIDELDAYRIFLVVHGEENDLVSFRLFDHGRGKERRIRCDSQITFHADGNFGTLAKPYVFNFITDYDVLFEAEICEGEYYTEHNFRVYRQGTYFQELVGQHGNDSIVRLDLTVNPVYHVEEEVVAVGFPFEYKGVVFDKAGTHVLPFQTAAACDSVWVVNVVPYEGVRELLVSPIPAAREQRISLYYPFTSQEQKDLVVEVYNVAGSLVQSKKPIHFPIELDPFAVAGTYMVKITMGTGELVIGKIIVK